MTDKRIQGRPPTYGTAATERVVVRVTPAHRIELRRVADATGRGVSGVIREMIDERFDRPRRDWSDLATGPDRRGGDGEGD
jgi:hypothetical protein